MLTIKPACRGCSCNCGTYTSGCMGAKRGAAGASHCGRPGQCR